MSPETGVTPRTEAGRRLLAREAYNERSFTLITAEAICAIEDEAALLRPGERVIERLDRPGNRANGTRLRSTPASEAEG